MGWVKTSDCSLLNVGLAKEIKMYELCLEGKSLGYKLTACFETEERVLSYVGNLDDSDSMIQEILLRDLTTLHTSFRNICLKHFPEAEHQDGEDWDAYWERSEAFVKEKYKKVSEEELEVEVS